MKTIFIGSCGAEFLPQLEKYGYTAVVLPPSKRLELPVCSHADMLMINLSGKILTCEYYYEENQHLLRQYPVITTPQSHFPKYPGDVMLNALFSKKALYANMKYVSEEIKSHAVSNGFTLSHVNQGYAKCSVCCLENAYITSDKAIHASMRQNGENVLLIPHGSVSLAGYDYGFIGGASFYDDGKIFFFGSIARHPWGQKIKSFCEENLAEVICLSEDVLTDVGGAVLL